MYRFRGFVDGLDSDCERKRAEKLSSTCFFPFKTWLNDFMFLVEDRFQTSWTPSLCSYWITCKHTSPWTWAKLLHLTQHTPKFHRHLSDTCPLACASTCFAVGQCCGGSSRLLLLRCISLGLWRAACRGGCQPCHGCMSPDRSHQRGWRSSVSLDSESQCSTITKTKTIALVEFEVSLNSIGQGPHLCCVYDFKVATLRCSSFTLSKQDG